MEKFKYYNHSLIFDCNNDEIFAYTGEELRDAFKKYKKALFLIFTSHFDCGHDTGWYYVIRDSSENHLNQLSPKHRKNLKRIFKFVECKMIVASDYAERIKEIGISATKGYKNYHDNQKFGYSDKRIIVGAFQKNTNNLIGYSIIGINRNQVSIMGEKVDCDYRQLGVSYALNDYIINKYLIENHNGGGVFITNGQKTIIHNSKHNQFLIDNLGFRKAYCYLHIVYRPIMKIIMPVVRLCGPVLKLFDNCHRIHLVNALLYMDKIVREQKIKFKDYYVY